MASGTRIRRLPILREINVAVSASAVDIRVRDNGIGIDTENQGKVFNMFYRVSNKSIGSGLGLYIVKEAVENCRRNRAQLRTRKGSEFTSICQIWLTFLGPVARII